LREALQQCAVNREPLTGKRWYVHSKGGVG